MSEAASAPAGQDTQSKAGKLFVIAAPSGAGKTTLVKALVKSEPRLNFSVSHTTRAPRAGEIDGLDYHFVDRAQFEDMVRRGEFLEHAEVFDNMYGTSRDAVVAQLARGEDVILEIDWQGAAQVRSALPESRSIFILPPTRDALERRLRKRATDCEAVIRRRLRDSISDMRHWAEFDYVVINDDLEQALSAMRDVIHLRGAASRSDRPEVARTVDGLLDNGA